MPDFRVHCVPIEKEPAELRLSAAESHHLVVVNRARRGDPVVAFDGNGREWDTELATDSKSAALLRVRSVRAAKPLGYELSLAQALPKGPSMDAIVRKATELGVRRIVPLSTERTQVHLEADRQEKKVEKWQTAALEAAKQCGNPWLPEISSLTPFPDFLHAGPKSQLKLVASLHSGAQSLNWVLTKARERLGPLQTVTWLVGPEGDFSPAEMEQAISAGFEPVTLGPLVLRCETAATYAVSVLTYELQGRLQ